MLHSIGNMLDAVAGLFSRQAIYTYQTGEQISLAVTADNQETVILQGDYPTSQRQAVWSAGSDCFLAGKMPRVGDTLRVMTPAGVEVYRVINNSENRCWIWWSPALRNRISIYTAYVRMETR